MIIIWGITAMELTDYAAYLWMFPVALQLLLPLVLSCFGLAFFALKHVGSNLVEKDDTSLQPSAA